MMYAQLCTFFSIYLCLWVFHFVIVVVVVLAMAKDLRP